MLALMYLQKSYTDLRQNLVKDLEIKFSMWVDVIDEDNNLCIKTNAGEKRSIQKLTTSQKFAWRTSLVHWISLACLKNSFANLARKL